jgi:hypothetical protein
MRKRSINLLIIRLSDLYLGIKYFDTCLCLSWLWVCVKSVLLLTRYLTWIFLSQMQENILNVHVACVCSTRYKCCQYLCIILNGISKLALCLYSRASLIWMPLIRMLHHPDDFSGNKLYDKTIKCDSVIRTFHLSGRIFWELKCLD